MFLYDIAKFFEHPFREDRVVKINFILSVLINLITWLILYIKLHPLSFVADSGQIYLHYNLYFGIDNMGSWYESLIIPALGVFIIIFNNLLGYFFYIKEKMLSYLLVVSQTLLQIILLAAAIFVILLNI